jgi:hypothetical protein
MRATSPSIYKPVSQATSRVESALRVEVTLQAGIVTQVVVASQDFPVGPDDLWFEENISLKNAVFNESLLVSRISTEQYRKLIRLVYSSDEILYGDGPTVNRENTEVTLEVF